MTSINKKRGFTIVEAMVVVAVMGIVAVFAVPAMQDVVRTSRIGTQADELATSLILAKNEAITKRRTVYVLFTLTPSGGIQKWELRYDNATTGEVIKNYTALESASIKRSPNTKKTFYFTPVGQFWQDDSAPVSIQPMDFIVCSVPKGSNVGRTVKVTGFGGISNLRHANAVGCQ